MKGLLFTYLLTYGGAAVSLFDPFRGLLVYVSFAIIKPEALWYWSVPQGNYSRTIAIAVLLGWLFNGCGKFRPGPARGIAALLAGFWLWSLIGGLFASDQSVAWPFVEAMTKILLPFLVGVTTIDSVAKLRQLAWVIVGSQGYVALEMNLDYFAGNNTLRTDGFAGMDNNSAAIGLVTGLGVAFFLGFSAGNSWRKWAALGLAALMAHAVLFSFSRGGMLAMICATGVAFLLVPKQPRHLLGFAALLVGAVVMAGPEVRARFSSTMASEEERDDSASSRLQLWADCWDVMRKNPVFGAGPDHWPLLASRYGWNPGKEAHSLWMQTGAELGFVGLSLLLGFYGLCMARLWPLTKRRAACPDPWLAAAARMVIMSLSGFCVAAQFVSLEALEIPYYVALLGAMTAQLASSARLEAARGRLQELALPFSTEFAFARHCGERALRRAGA